MRDLQGLEILQAQSQAQLILALGYLLEYTASNQAMEIIRQRIANRNLENIKCNNGEEVEEADNGGQQDFNESIEADKTALIAAEFELYGQIILTKLDYIKRQRLPEDLDREDFFLTLTANNEIYYGAVFGLVGFILNYQGAKLLYYISNQNVTFD